MVEATLVSEVLTPEMINKGAGLIQRLDKLRISIRAAFWLFLPETGRWRLFLASPEVRTTGPKALYSRVRSILLKMSGDPHINLDQVAIVDVRDPVVQAFTGVIGTGDGISGVRVTNSSFNGYFITDAYLYRQTVRRGQALGMGVAKRSAAQPKKRQLSGVAA